MPAEPPVPTVGATLPDALPAPVGLADEGEAERARVQARTLRLLFVTQVGGGVGLTIGVAIGALLAARLGGIGVSGLAQSSIVIGAALLAVPTSRLMRARGRRPGLAAAYLTGAVGAGLVILAVATHQVWLMFIGMLLFGGGSTANLQARYSAVDLAPPSRRARQLSLIVWATTIGAVTAPNLADPADRLLQHLGAPELTGPFFLSIVVFGLVGVAILALLRPDPLLTARRLAGTDPAAVTGARGGMRDAWREIVARPAARLAIGAVATGHLVMVGIMAMTPVHMDTMPGMHDSADEVRIIGFVLSIHVAGMYALSPLVGLAADRFGRRTVVIAGVGVLLTACALAGTAGESTLRLGAALLLLGFGWSCLIVAGSALLTESMPATVRPAAQGLSDLVMGVAGAVSGALSAWIVNRSGYPTLTLIAALATVPLLALALRSTGARPATA